MSAHVRAQRAEEAGDDTAYLQRLGSAPTTSRAGVAVLAVGGALLTAGVIRYAVVRKRENGAIAGIGLGPGAAIVHIRW